MERDKEKCKVDVKDKLLLTLEEACAMCNIGMNRMREITKNPKCTFVIYSGRQRLVKRKALEEYIEKNVEF